jgi:hypothetical protein
VKVIYFTVGKNEHPLAHLIEQPAAGTQFRLVVKATDDMHIEVKTEDQLGDVSWRPAKLDNKRVIPRLLAMTLLNFCGTATQTYDLGVVPP